MLKSIPILRDCAICLPVKHRGLQGFCQAVELRILEVYQFGPDTTSHHICNESKYMGNC